MSIDNEGSVDRAELKRKAEAIVGSYPRPFQCRTLLDDDQVVVGVTDEDGEFSDFIDIRISDYSGYVEHDLALGKYIAAANPAAVLSLIAEIESLRKQLEASRYSFQECLNDNRRLGRENESLRSSREAEIERAMRLTIAECEKYSAQNWHRLPNQILMAVLAQLKGENNG